MMKSRDDGKLQQKVAGLLGRVVSLSHRVDEQLLDCLQRGVAILETADNCFKDLLEGLGALGDVLTAVLQDSFTGENVLHIHISMPGRKLDRVEALISLPLELVHRQCCCHQG